jgi:hypothetical protein
LPDDVRALLTAIVHGREAWSPYGVLERAGHRPGLIDRLVEYDLRLMPSVKDVSALPTAGKRLVIVAAEGHVLRFRIFDNDGKMVKDTDSIRQAARAPQIEGLRKRLEKLWPPHELTTSEKDRVIDAVTSIVGHTRRMEEGLLARWEAHPDGFPDRLQITLSRYGAYVVGTRILGREDKGKFLLGPGENPRDHGRRGPTPHILTAEREESPKAYDPGREIVQRITVFWDLSGRAGGPSPRVVGRCRPLLGDGTVADPHSLDPDDADPGPPRCRRSPRRRRHTSQFESSPPGPRYASLCKPRTNREFFKYDSASAYVD